MDDNIMAMSSNFGGYCPTAKAIVPLYAINNCDWCGNRHKMEYQWQWNETEQRKTWIAFNTTK